MPRGKKAQPNLEEMIARMGETMLTIAESTAKLNARIEALESDKATAPATPNKVTLASPSGLHVEDPDLQRAVLEAPGKGKGFHRWQRVELVQAARQFGAPAINAYLAGGRRALCRAIGKRPAEGKDVPPLVGYARHAFATALLAKLAEAEPKVLIVTDAGADALAKPRRRGRPRRREEP